MRDGDVVQIGETRIAFRDPRRHESLATLPAQAVPAPIRVSDAQRRVLVALCRPFGEQRPFATAPTNEQIAAELTLGTDAVKTHRARCSSGSPSTGCRAPRSASR